MELVLSRIGYVRLVQGVAEMMLRWQPPTRSNNCAPCRSQGSLISIKSRSLSARNRRTTWLQLQCPKSGEVDLLQVQHGNGTAIIRWRWLADPQAGVRGAATMGSRKVFAGRYGSRQVVYGEEVTQEGSQGRSSEVCWRW